MCIGRETKVKSDYYEKTSVGWVLHSKMVHLRRSMGQYKRYSLRRNLRKWMELCAELKNKIGVK